MTDRELNLDTISPENLYDELNAAVLADGGARVTRLLSGGREVARIVPPGYPASKQEQFWRGALARVRENGETIWFRPPIGGPVYAGLAPVSRLLRGPDSTRVVPDAPLTEPGTGDPGEPDVISRVATLFAALGSADARLREEITALVPVLDEGVIERWLRHGE
jgi:hypothetical protein